MTFDPNYIIYQFSLFLHNDYLQGSLRRLPSFKVGFESM
jgi:hypothetical protein